MNGHEESQSTCACGGSCGCGGAHEEVYLTREEYVGELEKYLVRLQQEIESVELELAQLRQPA
jgi:hypothetical protein